MGLWYDVELRVRKACTSVDTRAKEQDLAGSRYCCGIKRAFLQ